LLLSCLLCQLAASGLPQWLVQCGRLCQLHCVSGRLLLCGGRWRKFDSGCDCDVDLFAIERVDWHQDQHNLGVSCWRLFVRARPCHSGVSSGVRAGVVFIAVRGGCLEMTPAVVRRAALVVRSEALAVMCLSSPRHVHWEHIPWGMRRCVRRVEWGGAATTRCRWVQRARGDRIRWGTRCGGMGLWCVYCCCFAFCEWGGRKWEAAWRVWRSGGVGCVLCACGVVGVVVG